MEQVVFVVWVLLAVALVIIEATNTGILAIWFAIGAGVSAAIAWFYPGSYIAQLLSFIIVSTILTAIGTFLLKNNQTSKSAQPIYSILDKEGLVTKEINNAVGNGQITINGDIWSAKSKDNSIIPENTKVKIVEVDGVKAVVEKI